MLALDAILSTANKVSHASDQKLGALIGNKALISRIQKWSHHGCAGTLAPDYDLLQVTQQVVRKHNIEVIQDHIKSHQDDSRAYNDLPLQAKLNCNCDHIAGASHKCQICCDTLHKGYELPTGHIASLEIDELIITSHVATAIKEASNCREFIEYITQRASWQDKEIYHTIDGVAQSRAGKQLSSGQCLTAFELEFSLFATISQHHQMEQGIDCRFPRCQHFQETLVHVLRCPRASEICKGALTRALASIWKKPTCTFVIDMQWSTNGQVQWPGISLGPTDDIGQLTLQAFQEQQQIGWDQGIRGRWSKNWGQANGLYCISDLNRACVVFIGHM